MVEPSIEICRTEEFTAAANKLSDFIAGLNLSGADNNRLICLMLSQIKQAEHDAYLQGFELGVRVTKENIEERAGADEKRKNQ